jgi:hypothetical protein
MLGELSAMVLMIEPIVVISAAYEYAVAISVSIDGGSEYTDEITVGSVTEQLDELLL